MSLAGQAAPFSARVAMGNYIAECDWATEQAFSSDNEYGKAVLAELKSEGNPGGMANAFRSLVNWSSTTPHVYPYALAAVRKDVAEYVTDTQPQSVEARLDNGSIEAWLEDGLTVGHWQSFFASKRFAASSGAIAAASGIITAGGWMSGALPIISQPIGLAGLLLGGVLMGTHLRLRSNYLNDQAAQHAVAKQVLERVPSAVDREALRQYLEADPSRLVTGGYLLSEETAIRKEANQIALRLTELKNIVWDDSVVKSAEHQFIMTKLYILYETASSIKSEAAGGYNLLAKRGALDLERSCQALLALRKKLNEAKAELDIYRPYLAKHGISLQLS